VPALWGAPWTVVAFVMLQLQIPVNVARGNDFDATVGVTLTVFAVLMVFLWRGSRVAWTILFLFEAFALLSQPFAPAAWWAWTLNLIGLLLLLAPPSRGHVWGYGTFPKVRPSQAHA